MKFIEASSIIALLAAASTAEATFTPSRTNIAAHLPQRVGWLLGDALRGGSMGKEYIAARCGICLSKSDCMFSLL